MRLIELALPLKLIYSFIRAQPVTIATRCAPLNPTNFPIPEGEGEEEGGIILKFATVEDNNGGSEGGIKTFRCWK